MKIKKKNFINNTDYKFKTKICKPKTELKKNKSKIPDFKIKKILCQAYKKNLIFYFYFLNFNSFHKKN